MILKFCVCLDSRFFGFGGGSVGFELAAVVALFELLRSILRRALGKFLALMRRFHAHIVLFNFVYLSVNVYLGLGYGAQGAFVFAPRVARRLVLFFKVKPRFCLARRFVKSTFLDELVFLRDSRTCLVVAVSRFLRFLDILVKLGACPFFIGEL